MMCLSSLVIVLVVFLAQKTLSYHLGGNDTNCWRGPLYTELALDCDTVGEIHFTPSSSADAPLYINEPFSVVAELIPDSPLIRQKGYLVPHANIHMCRAELGWCTPDVSVTQDLVTQSPPIVSDSLILNVTNLMVAIPGQWSVVAHFTIANEFGEWDIAAGFKRRFLVRTTALGAEDWAVKLIYAFSGIGLCCALVTGMLITHARNHWVFRASSPNLSIAVIFGCAIAFASVFTLPPPAFEYDSPEVSFAIPTQSPQCTARVWMLSLAFDFVLIPLALKTWRVSVIFSGTFNRVSITDVMLTRSALLLLLLDIIFCCVWTLGFPLTVGRIPTLSNPDSVFIIQCVGRNQLAFELISIIAHGLPLIWLAFVGRKVRSSFRKRSLNGSASSYVTDPVPHRPGTSSVIPQSMERKLSQFNESESLALTLTSLACMSIFAIALQYTVTDSPTAQTLMIACGVLWSAFFVLVVLFVPRFVDYVRFEKDGITKRQSGNAASNSINNIQAHSSVASAISPTLRRHFSRDSNSKRQSSAMTTVEVLIVGMDKGSGLSVNANASAPNLTLVSVCTPPEDCNPSTSAVLLDGRTSDENFTTATTKSMSPTLISSSSSVSSNSQTQDDIASHIADLVLL